MVFVIRREEGGSNYRSAMHCNIILFDVFAFLKPDGKEKNVNELAFFSDLKICTRAQFIIYFKRHCVWRKEQFVNEKNSKPTNLTGP